MKLVALLALGVMGTCGGLHDKPLQAPPPPTAEPAQPAPSASSSADAGPAGDAGAKKDAASEDDDLKL